MEPWVRKLKFALEYTYGAENPTVKSVLDMLCRSCPDQNSEKEKEEMPLAT